MPGEIHRALFALVVCAAFGAASVWLQAYARDSTRRWFRASASQCDVTLWTEADFDEGLHKLSRWEEFDAAQFRSFVAHQIAPLRLARNASFRFLEAGVGVGAFARVLLRAYPNATGVGFDLEPKAVAIARRVLPRDRMPLVFEADMLTVQLPHTTALFDYIFVPGALCYLHSLDDIQAALARLVRLLRPGGGLCASMLASMRSDTGSCNTRIPKAMWLSPNKRAGGTLAAPLTLLSIEDMDTWRLPHAFGRYAVCLTKKST